MGMFIYITCTIAFTPPPKKKKKKKLPILLCCIGVHPIHAQIMQGCLIMLKLLES